MFPHLMPSSVSYLLVFLITLAVVFQLAPAQRADSSSCPLNFTRLDDIRYIGDEVSASSNLTFRCTSFIQALHYVLVEYTASSGFLLVPDGYAESCWNKFISKLRDIGTTLDVTSLCNLSSTNLAWSSAACRNITSVYNLTQIIPQPTLSGVSYQCANASTASLSLCTACTSAVVQATSTYLPETSPGRSINSCQDSVALYAASTATNASRSLVAACLFNIADFDTSSGPGNSLKYIYGGIGAAVGLLLLLGILCFLLLRRRSKKCEFTSKYKTQAELSKEKMSNPDSHLIWFTLDEIKAATGNFARQNIVGVGRSGNVYRGKLPDGSEVAVKRFKNCSPAGDAEFFHEVEVVSSVKHRNLVALIGCCVSMTENAGYQRIIVCEYMPNGSLHDQLFTEKTYMDWPRRQAIAMCIVRGLSYLHQEVQPAIIHRDIKASNILLDANWNARVADFGLAKFRPEDASHLTTRVAGTHGYVAPEYVLYGQLTEKSDVYSFGIVLLELLTGRKILQGGSVDSLLITDWAWSLVKQGRVMEVVDPRMDNLGPSEIVERFVLLALLCSHPQVPLRPTMDKVLKIMENDQPLPLLAERPLPYTANAKAVERGGSSSSGSAFYSFSSEASSFLAF